MHAVNHTSNQFLRHLFLKCEIPAEHELVKKYTMVDGYTSSFIYFYIDLHQLDNKAYMNTDGRYSGIIRIRGGSILVEFVGTPHSRNYILKEIIRKKFIEHFNETRRNMGHPLMYNKQASMLRIKSVNNQIIAPLF